MLDKALGGIFKLLTPHTEGRTYQSVDVFPLSDQFSQRDHVSLKAGLHQRHLGGEGRGGQVRRLTAPLRIPGNDPRFQAPHDSFLACFLTYTVRKKTDILYLTKTKRPGTFQVKHPGFSSATGRASCNRLSHPAGRTAKVLTRQQTSNTRPVLRIVQLQTHKQTNADSLRISWAHASPMPVPG